MVEQTPRPSRGGTARPRASVGAAPQRGRQSLGEDGRPVRAGDDRPRPRRVEPELPDDVTGDELDPSVSRDLSTLSRDNATAVARHLVVAGRLLEDDPQLALVHARAAAGRAGRLAAVREAAGLTAYAAQHPDEALRELRAARRLSGDLTHLPLMADCERALGRPEHALELARSAEAASLSAPLAAEMRIVASGARADLGQVEAAVLELRAAELLAGPPRPWHARTYVAQAEALRAAGRGEQAPVWEARARRADPRGTSGAFPDPSDADEVVVVEVDDGDDDAADGSGTGSAAAPPGERR